MLEGGERDQQPPDFPEEVMHMKMNDCYGTHVVQADGSPEDIERSSMGTQVGSELDGLLRHFNLSAKVRY
jgi:hypothetical protein